MARGWLCLVPFVILFVAHQPCNTSNTEDVKLSSELDIEKRTATPSEDKIRVKRVIGKVFKGCKLGFGVTKQVLESENSKNAGEEPRLQKENCCKFYNGKYEKCLKENPAQKEKFENDCEAFSLPEDCDGTTSSSTFTCFWTLIVCILSTVLFPIISY